MFCRRQNKNRLQFPGPTPISWAGVDPRVAKLVNLRYFGGSNLREAAEDLGVAPRTADAWWAYARAWLTADLSRG